MSGIREVVARAMWADTDDCPQRGWPNVNGVTKTIYQSNARVAIETFLDVAAEQGWTMRPDEATADMTMAFIDAMANTGDGFPVSYRAMMAAAPKFELDR